MVTELTRAQTVEMLNAVADTIIAAKDQLGKLDSEIGDGDHGIGMALGMKEAKKGLAEKEEFKSINEIFYTYGMSMMTSMGGASGIIFALLFMGGANSSQEQTNLDKDLLVDLFSNSLNEIKNKGKAEVGDKTMVDALEPAVKAMESEKSSDLVSVLDAAKTAACNGAESTKDLVAKFGRAKSLGTRSLGHPDAGSVSVAIIFRTMADYVSHL